MELRKKSNKIIARSYNKFFKVDERKETNLNMLEKTLIFPVKFYLKYNGFLGILSIHDGELFFASKKANEGPHVEYFKTIFYQEYSEKQIKALKQKMLKDKVTVLFEVIDPVNDPHIIEYNEPSIILLDMVYNTNNYAKMTYEELQDLRDDYSFKIKELVYTANNLDEFKDIYTAVTSIDYKLNDEYVEGFVIEDSNNFMVKTKTNYYHTWKCIRSKMEKALESHNFKTECNSELEELFMQFLQKKYEKTSYDIKKINIIDERKEFLRK